jgi:hypothetical protein
MRTTGATVSSLASVGGTWRASTTSRFRVGQRDGRGRAQPADGSLGAFGVEDVARLRDRRRPASIPQPCRAHEVPTAATDYSHLPLDQRAPAVALACGAQGDVVSLLAYTGLRFASSSACASKTSISRPGGSASDARSHWSAASSLKGIQSPRQASGPSRPGARDADSLREDLCSVSRPTRDHLTQRVPSRPRELEAFHSVRSVVGEIGRPTLRVHDLRHT